MMKNKALFGDKSMFWKRKKIGSMLDKLKPYIEYLEVNLHFHKTPHEDGYCGKSTPQCKEDWNKFIAEFKPKLTLLSDDEDDPYMFYSFNFKLDNIEFDGYSPHFKNPKAIKKKVRCKIIKDNLKNIEDRMGSMLFWAWKKGYTSVSNARMEKLFKFPSEFSNTRGKSFSWNEHVSERKKILDRRRKACEEIEG